MKISSKSISISILVLLLPTLLLATDISLFDDIEYVLPLGHHRKVDYNKLKCRIIGKFGDNRNSNIRGHKHAGIDIRGDFSDTVYSIGSGTVTHIFRYFPHKTIYIRHNENLGFPFYSVYIHVEDIQVNIGDVVTENTNIGRIFNEEELQAAGFGTPPHLHFEIRHDISDNGDATFESMSISELNRYCIDPLIFFKNIKKRTFFSHQLYKH